MANEACDAGRVLINGKPAKASAQVKAGDILEIQFGSRTVRVEVLDVQETVKKRSSQRAVQIPVTPGPKGHGFHACMKVHEFEARVKHEKGARQGGF